MNDNELFAELIRIVENPDDPKYNLLKELILEAETEDRPIE